MDWRGTTDEEQTRLSDRRVKKAEGGRGAYQSEKSEMCLCVYVCLCVEGRIFCVLKPDSSTAESERH